MHVTIAGAGAYLPPHIIDNERLVKAIPGWSAARIAEKTGIRERRYLWDFDEEEGRTIPPSSIADPGPTAQVCEPALREALAMARLDPCELDGLIVTTCTPDQTNFSHDALLLHRRIGMRPEAFALVHDDGCGGAMFHLAMAREWLLGGQRRTIAIVGANVISPLLCRDTYTRTLAHNGAELGAYLTFYLFGDGAGAIILRAEPERRDSGIVASYAANEQVDLVIRRGGGNMWPAHPGRLERSDPAFYVDGRKVAACFEPLLTRAIDGALERAGLGLHDIERFYLHQANKRVLEAFVDKAGIPRERVAMHMERYGNITTAGTLVLLAEDLRAGRVRLGGGAPVLMAAIGAGAQCAAHVIRL
ncbi:MAG: 3-oxoacyl-[acyl-carrier-protein] synthase III C-terminal domain-containing protein [Nannocystaceae bacterium]